MVSTLEALRDCLPAEDVTLEAPQNPNLANLKVYSNSGGVWLTTKGTRPEDGGLQIGFFKNDGEGFRLSVTRHGSLAELEQLKRTCGLSGRVFDWGKPLAELGEVSGVEFSPGIMSIKGRGSVGDPANYRVEIDFLQGEVRQSTATPMVIR